jgi:protein-S-isoprenylcysteine O-methyltransferase Ste14
MKPARWRWDNVPVPEEHVVALGAAGLAQIVLPMRLPLGRRSARLVGWPTIAVGIGLAAWGVTSASAAGVGVDRPTSLVTTGAFAFSRNPMYLGWSTAVAGLGIAARSPWVLAAAAVAAGHTHRAIVAEEAMLAGAFGPEFDAYVARAPRYLGSDSLTEALGRVATMVRGNRRSAIGGDDDL